MASGFGIQYDRIPIYTAGIEATKEYIRAERIKKINPRVRLLLSPFIPPFVPVEIFSADIGGLIQSLSWGKSRSSPGGAFNCEIAADDHKLLRNVPAGILRSIWDLLGQSAEDMFRPMAQCQLWLDGYHVCTGYITGCRRRVTADGEKFYSVSVSELGNLYNQNICQNETIYIGVDYHIIDDLNKILMQGNKQIVVPLALAVYNYVNAFLMSSIMYGPKSLPMPYWSGSDGVPMAFRMIAQPPPIGGISLNSILSMITTDATLFKQGGGSSFWDFLKSLTAQPFIEMFTETGGRTICVGRLFGAAGIGAGAILTSAGGAIPLPSTGTSVLLPGFNYLIMRSTPYGNPLIGLSLWNAAIFPFLLDVFDLIIAGDYIIVTDDDVIDKDLGRTEEQQYTIFQAPLVAKSGSGEGAKMFSRPAVAGGPILPFMPGGARTFGSREMMANVASTSLQWGGVATQVVEKFTGKTAGIPGMQLPTTALTSLLKFWFRNASKFKEGTIRTRAIPYAKPGMVLLYMPSRRPGAKVENPRDIGIYYIDNISYQYGLGEAPTSTFSVIRGVPAPLGSEALGALKTLLLDWEVWPVGLNLIDGAPEGTA